MTKEEIISKMKAAGHELKSTKNMEYGINMYFSNNSNVAYYKKSGKYVPGGKNREETKRILEDTINVCDTNKEIFIVYGHDEEARNELELILRRWGLTPIILSQQAPEGRTLIEALEFHLDKINYGIVIATPDDVGYKSGCENKKRYRVRQNVVFELGMLIAKLGRSNVSILLKNTSDLDMEKPSDIDGLIYLNYTDTINECKEKLAYSLKKNGFELSE